MSELVEINDDGGLPSEDLEPSGTVHELTKPQKAAVLIAAMGPDVAGPIVEKIGDKQLRNFARAFSQLRAVPREALEQVVEEFLSDVHRDHEGVRGGFKETQRLLSHFVSTDALTRILDDIDAPGGKSVWEKLDGASEFDLSEYLATQHPQVIAVILGRVSSEMAAKVLDLFDEDLTKAVLLRMARMSTVDQRFVHMISETVNREFLKPLRKRSMSRKPSDMLSTVINYLPQAKRVSALEFIEGEEPTLAEEIKQSLLTFQDLSARLPQSAVVAIVRVADRNLLLQALKFGRQNAATTVDFFFNNLSKRMGQQIEEDMAKLKSVKMKDAEAAQNAIIEVIRKLVDNGEIELIELQSGDEDEYL